MRICKEHWAMCREAIDERGMSDLGAKSGEEAAADMVAELNGEDAKFDPLMSMNNHWSSEALRAGGLYLMGETENGENDGHYCPICEFEKNAEGFEAKPAIGMIADQMRQYACEAGLIPLTQ